jgi:hypothetical protein
MASYQIIILNSNTQPDGSFVVTGVFWLTANTNNIIPLPNFVSAVPFIDITDLKLLQAGTIVEQAFNSGCLVSGTTLASVQADLQTLYTAAQTSLGSLNPPLANMVGTVYNGTSWTTSSPFTEVFETAVTGTLGALNATVQIATTSGQSVGVQVNTGTFIGTIIAETSFDGLVWNQTIFVFAGNTTLFSKSFSISYASSPNGAQAGTIVVNGGAGLVRVRVFAYTSGSCNVTMSSSGIFDQTIDLFTAGQGSPIPPQIAITGGSVTTAAPTYTTGTANAVSLNAAGGLRVDGSGVTQPVSGTVAISGTVANTQSTSPWVDNVTQIGGVAVAAVAKGTQATNALGTQDIKDSGRVAFFAVANALAGVTTEALVSLTPIRTVTATAAATSLAVTAAKTMRLQSLVLTVRNTSTVQSSAVIRVRMLAGTVLIGSQEFFSLACTVGDALTGGVASTVLTFPDGVEISGTTQFGISQLCSATTSTLDISLIGFEY